MRNRGPCAVIAAAFALALFGDGQAFAEEPYHLRIGWVVTPNPWVVPALVSRTMETPAER